MKDNRAFLMERIPGWGADLERNERPGVPKEEPPADGTGAHWDEPEQQEAKVKIFTTIERDRITPVFGTSCPPRGLSGLIRSFAYRYGEAKAQRWMLLLFADRVDVVESIIFDLFRGRLPRPFKEMGLKSEFKDRYRPTLLSRNQVLAGAGAVAVAAVACGLLLRKR